MCRGGESRTDFAARAVAARVSETRETGQPDDGSGDTGDPGLGEGPEDGGLAAGIQPDIPGGVDDADGGETVGPDVPTDADVDPELRTLFWKLVLLYKLTVFGGTLGALLLVFDRGPNVGLELFGGAVVLLGYTLYRTGQAKTRIDAGEFHDGPEAGGRSAGATAGPGQEGEP